MCVQDIGEGVQVNGLFPLSLRSSDGIITFGQGVNTRRRACWTQGRQVVYMSAYEITMIIIASMTLLLKLIQVIKDLIQK